MPPNHEHDHDHKPTPKGPKERELAVALTVAVLNAARIDGPLAAIEQMTLDVSDRMLAAIAITKPGADERNDRRE